jgi:hypothetical protein
MRKLALFIAAVSSMGLSAAEPQLKNTGLYYRLFAPLTFYHNVASSQFNIISNDSDEVSQAIDQALMHVYLKRPELVKVTESEQEEAGSLRQDIIETPVMQEVEMVEQAAPMPETPEAAPVEVVIEKPNFWKYKGDASLQVMQNYVSDNWYKGGESNQAAVGTVTLEANYDNKSKWKWDNKLEMKLGFQTSPSDTVHKFKTNEDLIRYTGKVGLQAANRWYYTLQMLAYTQFYHGLKSNNTKVFSDFMSPFNLSVGLGMDYKVQALANKLTGTINMSPLAVNYRYVDRADLAASFGVKTPDHSHSLTDFGSQITASLTWQVNDVLSWKTRIYGFSSYHRSEVEWENTFTLRVSKYISANLFLFPRFDDANNRDENLGYWQFKEYSSLGFSYNF